MREMSFTKLKAISHSLCKALGIPLCCTVTKIRLLYISTMREKTVHLEELNLHHYYKQNFRRINITEFVAVFGCAIYYFYVIY